MFDRTEPAIGRTSRQTEAISFREIAAVCRLFLFAIWLSLPSPHGSDRCVNTGKRILPNIPDLQILHVNTHVKIWRIIQCVSMQWNAEREEKGYTQVQLSETVRISFDHLRAIEHGRRTCSIELLVDLHVLFDVSLDYLILGKTSQLDAVKTELQRAVEMIEKVKREL